MNLLGICFYWAWTWAVAGPAAGLAIVLYAVGRHLLKGIRRAKLANKLTGAEAAGHVLSAGGAGNVVLVRGKRKSADQFDPVTNTLLLSRRAFKSRRLPHVAAACQEAGHAIAYAADSRGLAVRNVVVRITRLAGRLGLLLFLYWILGMFCLCLPGLPRPPWLVDVCICILAAVLLAQLAVLPVEFDAARRALDALQKANVLAPGEEVAMGRAMKVAALDYVTECAWSVLWFSFRRRRRR